MRVHDVFHVSLLKKHVKYVDNVIELSVSQVEIDGEIQSDSYIAKKGAHASEPSNRTS